MAPKPSGERLVEKISLFTGFGRESPPLWRWHESDIVTCFPSGWQWNSSRQKLLGHGRIKLLGRNYRFNQSRPINGIVETVKVRRDPLKDFHLTFRVTRLSSEDIRQTSQAASDVITAESHGHWPREYVKMRLYSA